MGKILEKFVYLVNLFFTILCLLHIFVNLYVNLNPPHPDIKVHDKLMKDVPFPILLKLCGKEIHDSSKRFRIFGYKDEIEFYAGKSKFSSKNFGWNGHTENGSTLGLTVTGSTLTSNGFFFIWKFRDNSKHIFRLEGHK